MSSHDGLIMSCQQRKGIWLVFLFPLPVRVHNRGDTSSASLFWVVKKFDMKESLHIFVLFYIKLIKN